MLASPGPLKLPIKHDRHHTLEDKDLFPAISSLFALPEPEEAAHPVRDEASPSLPTLPTAARLLHQQMREIILLQPLASTLVQRHFSITEHLD